MRFGSAIKKRYRCVFAIFGVLLLVSNNCLAMAAPARATSPGYVLKNLDRDRVVYHASITMEAEARSQDVVVRALRGQVNDLTRQLRDGKGDLTRIRADLAATQDEMVRRLADSDAAFAVERARFAASISALFESKDPVILDLLRRYAEGEAKALSELQARIESSASTPMQRLVDQHAFATLVVDAVAKKERSEEDAIAAYEAILRDNPDDYLALTQLPGRYLLIGQTQRARAILEKLDRIQACAQFDTAPQARATSLHIKAVAAWKEGDLDTAAKFAQASIAIYREQLAVPYRTWQLLHPTATEPAWMIEQGTREWLANPLDTLARIEIDRGNYAAAEQTARESYAQRKLIIDDRNKGNGKPDAYPYAAAASSASTLGRALLAACDPAAAMTAYQLALDTYSLGEKLEVAQSETKREIAVPFWTLIRYARAAILAGQIDQAAIALDNARSAIQSAEPRPFVIGNEGLYWLEKGNLLMVRGEGAEARKAWLSAQSSLAQAVSVDRDDPSWQAELKVVNGKLSAVPQ